MLEGAFHGRTMGSLSATPGLTTDDRCRPTSGDSPPSRATTSIALGAAVSATGRPRVMLEPIQGETGVHVIPDEMTVAARELCDATGALLVFDEIQSGVGRTGTLWAYEQLPVRPDVMTHGKGAGRRAAGGGLRGRDAGAGGVLERGDHGSTFAGRGHRRAALAAFGVIDDAALLRRVRESAPSSATGPPALNGVREASGPRPDGRRRPRARDRLCRRLRRTCS